MSIVQTMAAARLAKIVQETLAASVFAKPGLTKNEFHYGRFAIFGTLTITSAHGSEACLHEDGSHAD